MDLKDCQHLNAESMRRFIQHLKLDVHVTVLNVFKTKSVMVFFEITIDLWYCLQPHPAIQLLALSRPDRFLDMDPPNTILAIAGPGRYSSFARVTDSTGNAPGKIFQDIRIFL